MIAHALLFIGPPASGKGTHGKVIGQLPGYVHFSMGAAFRSMDARDEEEAAVLREVNGYTHKGELVPDGLVLQVFAAHLAKMQASGAFSPQRDILILDGIPRTATQARGLKGIVAVEHVVEFACGRMEIVRRVGFRALVEGRVDDTVEILQHRLEIYEAQREELLGVYGETVKKVNAEQDAAYVLRDLLDVVLG